MGNPDPWKRCEELESEVERLRRLVAECGPEGFDLAEWQERLRNDLADVQTRHDWMAADRDTRLRTARGALEWYANEFNWDEGICFDTDKNGRAWQDDGERARAALRDMGDVTEGNKQVHLTPEYQRGWHDAFQTSMAIDEQASCPGCAAAREGLVPMSKGDVYAALGTASDRESQYRGRVIALQDLARDTLAALDAAKGGSGDEQKAVDGCRGDDAAMHDSDRAGSDHSQIEPVTSAGCVAQDRDAAEAQTCEGCGKPVVIGDGHCLWEDGKRTCASCQRKRMDAPCPGCAAARARLDEQDATIRTLLRIPHLHHSSQGVAQDRDAAEPVAQEGVSDDEPGNCPTGLDDCIDGTDVVGPEEDQAATGGSGAPGAGDDTQDAVAQDRDAAGTAEGHGKADGGPDTEVTMATCARCQGKTVPHSLGSIWRKGAPQARYCDYCPHCGWFGPSRGTLYADAERKEGE